MKENKNIPVGYKDSSVGVIPEDWEIVKLGDVGKIQMCKRIFNHETKEKGDIPFYKIGTFGKKADAFISRELYEDYLRKFSFPQKGDILISAAGTIGRTIVYNGEPAYFQDSNIVWINNNETKVLNIFLIYVYQIVKYTTEGGTIKRLYNNIINNTKFPLAPIPEQKKIAEILSTWDYAIEAQSKLVDKLKLRKQALMQQLLTGKKRLKGFDKEWKIIQIREIAKEVSIRNKNNKQIIVLSCTKYKGLVPSLEYFGKRIFAEDVSTYKVVPKSHFAYATNHIEEGSIGYQDLYDEGLISPMYTVFKTDSSINDNFFYTLLKSHKLIHHYNSRMEGSIDRRGGLRWEGFSGIKINIPSYEEQTAIANILSTADKEIEIANTRLDKLRDQKKGLMQQLLTGKKLVKLN